MESKKNNNGKNILGIIGGMDGEAEEALWAEEGVSGSWWTNTLTFIP